MGAAEATRARAAIAAVDRMDFIVIDGGDVLDSVLDSEKKYTSAEVAFYKLHV